MYLLAIDQGTTSSRAIVFDSKGNILGVGQLEFTQHYPHDGWVEHDPEEIWQTTLSAIWQAIGKAGIEATRIAAVGIANQRETTVVWDKETGKAVYPAIVWQDRRSASYCAELRAAGYEKQVQELTGLLLDPYFSATKIRWILDNVSGARQRAEAGHLAFGTIDSFLLWRLTDGTSHYTDATNASRTLLFDLNKQMWSDELLELFDIPAAMLPEVKDSSDDFGLVRAGAFGARIKVGGMVGDQQAALVGEACFDAGQAKSTYGTGCFLMLNTGDVPLISQNRLLTTVAYRIKGKPCYALEGSIFIAGAAIQWLRDGLGIIKSSSETEALAGQRPDARGVYLVSAFTGLGAPHWDPDARGALLGLTRDSDAIDIVVAALESVCYQTGDLLQAMAADNSPLAELRIDGGMAKNNLFMQRLADLTGLPVRRPRITETTALGAAFLAGLQAGMYQDLTDIGQIWQQDAMCEPVMPEEARLRYCQGWEQALARVKSHP
jgi:glycerol kinase